jgi:hypothetical protein
MRSFIALASAVAAVAAASPVAGARPTTCASLHVGPGSQSSGSRAGAVCLLAAFQDRCSSAADTLSFSGVDTVAEDDFRVLKRSGRCSVQVTRTFRIFPQRPHNTGHGFCTGLARRGADVVASGCEGIGLSPTISLTRRG